MAKVLSSVYLNGGTITLYQADGLDIFNIKNVNNCMVASNARSKINAARIPMKVHENGIALYISAEHRGKNLKIVVSGDQIDNTSIKSTIKANYPAGMEFEV